MRETALSQWGKFVDRIHVEHPKYDLSSVTRRVGIIAIAGTQLCPVNRALLVLASSQGLDKHELVHGGPRWCVWVIRQHYPASTYSGAR
jgi:hypothetical protein